ncbi:MAG: hypothetical protein ACKVJU_19950 [Verrucomicrobiales bacterium]
MRESPNPMVEIFDIGTGQKFSIRPPCGDFSAPFLLSPDGGRLAISQACDVYVYETVLKRRTTGSYTEVQVWDIRSGIPMGRPVRKATYDLNFAFSNSRTELHLMNLGNGPLEKWGDFSALTAESDERILLTLELLSGTEFGESGVRKRLSWEDIQIREERLQRIGGPLVPFPEFSDAFIPGTAEPTIAGPSNSEIENPLEQETLQEFIKNWIEAGNSDNTSNRSQSQFFADPAVIKGVSQSRMEIKRENAAFKLAFEADPIESDRTIQILKVRQSARLVATDGNIRQVEIVDELVIKSDSRGRTIQSRRRSD